MMKSFRRRAGASPSRPRDIPTGLLFFARKLISDKSKLISNQLMVGKGLAPALPLLPSLTFLRLSNDSDPSLRLRPQGPSPDGHGKCKSPPTHADRSTPYLPAEPELYYL